MYGLGDLHRRGCVVSWGQQQKSPGGVVSTPEHGQAGASGLTDTVYHRTPRGAKYRRGPCFAGDNVLTAF